MIAAITLNKKTTINAAKVYFLLEGQKYTALSSFISKKLDKKEFKGKLYETVFIEQDDNVVCVVGLGKESKSISSLLKNVVAHAVRTCRSNKIQSVDLVLEKIPLDDFESGKNVALGAILGNYSFTKYKNEDGKKKYSGVTEVNVVNISFKESEFKKGAEEGVSIAEGVILTRDLVNDPASHTNIESMVKTARTIADQSKGTINATILGKKECEALGMGSYLAVAKGSSQEPKFIILHKKGKKGAKKIAVIGKTVVFDSGGLSLKPWDAMLDMKIDMAGGGVVLGLFQILSQNDQLTDMEVYGILPACENMISGNATRPGDIAQALNKKTIEILNTDAEGRLTLADALSYAEIKLGVDYVVDLATLTGACMVALGYDFAGVFANDENFFDQFGTSASQEGEEYWRLPLHKPYLKQMKGDITDLKNIGKGRSAGAITAALFLSEFVEKTPWIHIDIAGPAYRSEPVGMLPKGATGWGVQSIVTLLRQLTISN